MAVAFVSVTGLKAQDANSVKVKVNVELKPFQSIEIGTGGKPAGGYGDEVTLRYATLADYKNGVSVERANQLKVSSVGSGYKVNAALSFAGAGAGNFKKELGGGVDQVAASELLEIAIGKTGTLTGASNGTTAAATLQFGPFGSTSDGASSVLDEQLDVKYFGKPLNEDMVRKLFGNQKTEAKYTIDVVYTIATN